MKNTPAPGVPARPGTQEDRAAILAALRQTPRRLPARFFYDERGAALFDEITRTAAYYPTRVETGILRAHAKPLSAWMGPGARIVEFGTGSGLKTRILLDAACQPASYVPIDVAGPQLQAVARELRQRYPSMEVLPLCADYTQPLQLPAADVGERRTVVFFPGSTIGNMEPQDALAFLRRIVSIAGPDGLLIIGVDCKKDVQVLERAYNDPEGVTAAFNRNILDHVNRITGADFDPSAFEHYAYYNPAAGRIEMHLIGVREQTVRIPDPGLAPLTIALRAGEAIVTEHSYKYTVGEFRSLAGQAGYAVGEVLTDADEYFAVYVLTPA